MKLHHIALVAQDVARVADFYELLGFKRMNEQQDDLGIRSIWLKMDEAILMIERADMASVKPIAGFHDRAPGYHLIAFRIRRDEKDAWMTKLSALRIPIVYFTDYTMYLMDPERNRIGLSFYGEEDQ
ncbi:MAG: VOC family protein [Leptospirales bacterium]|nr:VOC family protein [Leptospirales bacterium]